MKETYGNDIFWFFFVRSLSFLPLSFHSSPGSSFCHQLLLRYSFLPFPLFSRVYQSFLPPLLLLLFCLFQFPLFQASETLGLPALSAVCVSKQIALDLINLINPKKVVLWYNLFVVLKHTRIE